ncbi:hypothetical protein O6H91_06G040400 [Diphasiastrum complanatum]|uniref:Uncharacterized protein n=2 Tax=Diphasiastrum complanatum TaxID=34168 RepID=A0ACC2DD04_DIPCM|nr:hypothetical protein O6H91_06G040400 [Diphasiastrum complanatum]
MIHSCPDFHSGSPPCHYAGAAMAALPYTMRTGLNARSLGTAGRRICCSKNDGIVVNPVTVAESEIDKKVERFRGWLRSMGHEECNLKLQKCPGNDPAQGYGMVAGPGGIHKGRVVVKVPRRAFLSEETARNCPLIGPLAKRAALSTWQIMCLHLLCERARGQQSPWFSYICLLPFEIELVGAHPLLWPQRMRREWLAGSPMLDIIERRLQNCREDHEALIAAGASELMPVGTGSGGFITEAAVRWAAVILLSRAFSLDLEEQVQGPVEFYGRSIALVPWADMLNHCSSAGKDSCLAYSRVSDVATLRAHKSYTEGEQVYDSYGSNLSASQLLLDYGFVDQENQNHAVDLPASVLAPLKSKSNAILLEAVGLSISRSIYTLTPLGVDESVLAWTRVAVASPRELVDAGWREDSRGASSAMVYFSKPVSRENESEVVRRLLWACEALLNKYPTTLEEDTAMLVASDNTCNQVVSLPWARKQALRALISEKLALRGAQRVLWQRLQKLRSGLSLDLLEIQ